VGPLRGVAAAKMEATLSNSIEAFFQEGSSPDGVFAFYKKLWIARVD
jgi:hypothetical protein